MPGAWEHDEFSERYGQSTYTACYALLSNEDAALDAAARTLTEARSALDAGEAPELIRPWLRGLAYRHCADQVLVAPDRTVPPLDPAHVVASLDRARLVWHGIGSLGFSHRKVLSLKVPRELSDREVAEVMGLDLARAERLVAEAQAELELALKAVVVARAQRSQCATLAAELTHWTGGPLLPCGKLYLTVIAHLGACTACAAQRNEHWRPMEWLPVVIPLLLLPAGFRERLAQAVEEAAATTDTLRTVGAARTWFSFSAVPKAAQVVTFLTQTPAGRVVGLAASLLSVFALAASSQPVIPPLPVPPNPPAIALSPPTTTASTTEALVPIPTTTTTTSRLLPTPPPPGTTATPVVSTRQTVKPCSFTWQTSSDHNGFLNGIAASAPEDVWAVGSVGDGVSGPGARQGLIEHWDGHTWSTVPTPLLTNWGQLSSVTAPSRDLAWSVGFVVPPGNKRQAVVQRWDGSTWSTAVADNPGSVLNELVDVWATGTEGFAVGLSSSGVVQPLVLRWNGTKWQRVVPDIGHTAARTVLTGVGGTSPSDVWAVGNTVEGGVDRPLIVHWDGSTWRELPSPTVAGANTDLLRVTALAPGDVWAVGGSQNPTTKQRNQFVLHWNGTRWDEITAPNAEQSSLNAVAALSANDVWLLGSQGSGQPLLEHWDGTGITAMPLVQPGGELRAAVPVGGAVWSAGWVTAADGTRRTLTGLGRWC